MHVCHNENDLHSGHFVRESFSYNKKTKSLQATITTLSPLNPPRTLKVLAHSFQRKLRKKNSFSFSNSSTSISQHFSQIYFTLTSWWHYKTLRKTVTYIVKTTSIYIVEKKRSRSFSAKLFLFTHFFTVLIPNIKHQMRLMTNSWEMIQTPSTTVFGDYVEHFHKKKIKSKM